MHNPLVSIIIPTYNRAHLIGETLDSVIAQTYTNWECIIVDDGSTDNSEEVIVGYIEKEPRFQYHKRPVDRPKGGNTCRNYGFELSRGEFLKWFDSDDLMHPTFINVQVSILVNNPQLNFCASLGYYFENDISSLNPISANRQISKNNNIYNYLVNNHYFLTPACLWRKDFLLQKELFDTKITRGQETDFHFRMICLNPEYIYSNDNLYYIRRGNNDSISANSTEILSSHLSRIYMFNNFFFKIKGITTGGKSEMLNYLIFRQLVLFYELKINFNVSAYFFLKATGKMLLNYISVFNITFLKKVKLIFFYFMISVFGKGYKYLYFPEFDCRNKIQN